MIPRLIPGSVGTSKLGRTFRFPPVIDGGNRSLTCLLDWREVSEDPQVRFLGKST